MAVRLTLTSFYALCLQGVVYEKRIEAVVSAEKNMGAAGLSSSTPCLAVHFFTVFFKLFPGKCVFFLAGQMSNTS